MFETIVAEPIDFFTVEEEREMWRNHPPKKGDHIKVSRGVYTHHGVYVCDDEVIHFSAGEGDFNGDLKIRQNTFAEFLKDGELEVKIYTDEELDDLYPVDGIVSYARACLGDEGYNLVFNNCEHFANMCTLGRFRSKQVENVMDILTPKPKGGKKMGLFSWLGGLFGGGKNSGGSRETSHYNYNYDPDKVKIAEIENRTKITLANMEMDKINLMKEVQLELMDTNAKLQVAVMEAKARGFVFVQEAFIRMMREVNILGEERLKIIENSSFETIKQVEGYYSELEKKIGDDHYDYDKKIIGMLDTLEKFKDNPTSHEMYKKSIEQNISIECDNFTDLIKRIRTRQEKIIDSTLQAKTKIYEESHKMVETRLNQMALEMQENKEILKLNGINTNMGALENKSLDKKEQKSLPSE